MGYPFRRLTAAVIITACLLPLCCDGQVACVAHGFAKPSSPGRQSSLIGVDRRPAEEFIPGCDDDAKKVIERALVNVDSKVSQAYRASALPHTVLIDRSGMIRAIHVGPFPEKKLSLQIDLMLQDGAHPRR